VLRVGAAYIVAAWLVIQVVETIFPAFGFGDAAVRIVVIVLAIGFIPALILAWVFEITPKGLKKEKDIDRSQSIALQTGKTLDRIIIVVLVLALSYFAIDKFVFDPARDASRTAEARNEGRAEALVESYGENSIAVLPFVNMSDDASNEFLADGIAEELLNLLAQIPQLRVISRSSAFSYKGRDIAIPTVAKELNVAHVLEGSVRKFGSKIRITAQLIEARSDTHVWSETYNRTLDDIFVIQDEIAAAVVAELKQKLLGDAPTARRTNHETYTLYMDARYLLNKGNRDDNERAETLVKQALELDPSYVPGWTLLARIYGADRYLLARDATLKALAIDPDDALANAYFGAGTVFFENDLEVGIRALERALISAPNNPEVLNVAARIARVIGRFDEAVALAERAAYIDPRCRLCLHNLAGAQYLAGHLDAAAASIRRYQITGGGGWHTHGSILLLMGDAEAALEAFDQQKLPEFHWLSHRALALQTLGRRQDYESTLRQLTENWGAEFPWDVARVHAWAGNADAAFDWLHRRPDLDDLTFRVEFGRFVWDPFFKQLHHDARWLELRARAGLSPERLATIEFNVSLPPRFVQDAQ